MVASACRCLLLPTYMPFIDMLQQIKMRNQLCFGRWTSSTGTLIGDPTVLIMEVFEHIHGKGFGKNDGKGFGKDSEPGSSRYVARLSQSVCQESHTHSLCCVQLFFEYDFDFKKYIPNRDQWMPRTAHVDIIKVLQTYKLNHEVQDFTSKVLVAMGQRARRGFRLF